jgi:hypothetical protein
MIVSAGVGCRQVPRCCARDEPAFVSEDGAGASVTRLVRAIHCSRTTGKATASIPTAMASVTGKENGQRGSRRER